MAVLHGALSQRARRDGEFTTFDPSRKSPIRLVRRLVVVAALAAGVGWHAAAATAASFTATPHISDGATLAPAAGQCTNANPCTLRQAIVDANASTDSVNTIQLIQGTFMLDPAVGPLDANPVANTTENIEGFSPVTTVINGEQSNGVIQIGLTGTAGSVHIDNVEITGGAATSSGGSGDGGGSFVNTGGNLTLATRS